MDVCLFLDSRVAIVQPPYAPTAMKNARVARCTSAPLASTRDWKSVHTVVRSSALSLKTMLGVRWSVTRVTRCCASTVTTTIQPMFAGNANAVFGRA